MNTAYITLNRWTKIKGEIEVLEEFTSRKPKSNSISMNGSGPLIDKLAHSDVARLDRHTVKTRIVHLKHMLADSSIIDLSGSREKVAIGHRVALVDEKNQKSAYTIVGSLETDPRNGYISNDSPLGKSLLGHKEGDSISIDCPQGRVTYKIEDIR